MEWLLYCIVQVLCQTLSLFVVVRVDYSIGVSETCLDWPNQFF